MTNLSVPPAVMDRFSPFLEGMLAGYREQIDSCYITGSALTADFDPKKSDINSVVVLKKMALGFLTVLAPLGKQYGKRGIAAPLIMTPAYIRGSLDVFPIEFLNFKLLHLTVFGNDLFGGLDIGAADLRSQCERDLKAKLIGLRQGYLSAAGDRKVLAEHFIRAITGYLPLFRGIIFLFGRQPPLDGKAVLTVLGEATGVDTTVFATILKEKKERSRLSMATLTTLFEDYYAATEKLGEIIDGIAL